MINAMLPLAGGYIKFDTNAERQLRILKNCSARLEARIIKDIKASKTKIET
jgi:hypothetical protein